MVLKACTYPVPKQSYLMILLRYTDGHVLGANHTHTCHKNTSGTGINAISFKAAEFPSTRTLPMSLSEGNEEASASSDYGSQCSTGLSSNARRDEIAEREIAQKENRAMRMSKTVMFLVLLLFCAAAATVTYIFTKQGQENDFSTKVSLLLLALVLAFNRR
jgi:hypothetical protein